MVREEEHVRSWNLSHCKQEIWEWDWGSTESRIWGRKCFQQEGGDAHGHEGNCRAPELGSSIDRSGEQESREAELLVSNCRWDTKCGRGSCVWGLWGRAVSVKAGEMCLFGRIPTRKRRGSECVCMRGSLCSGWLQRGMKG